MKKLLSVLVTSALIFTSCLPAMQKVSYRTMAGASLAKYHQESSYMDESESSDSKAGFTAGVAADVGLAEQFSVQPALNFVQKGGIQKYEDEGDEYKSKITLNYLELPVNFLFRPQSKSSVQFFVGAGPSLAMALSGKNKETWPGGSDTDKLKIGNDPDKHDLKRMDFGANFIAGIDTKMGITVALNYNLGLSNVAPGDSDDGSIKNNYFGLKLGYIFKTKSK